MVLFVTKTEENTKTIVDLISENIKPKMNTVDKSKELNIDRHERSNGTDPNTAYVNGRAA